MFYFLCPDRDFLFDAECVAGLWAELPAAAQPGSTVQVRAGQQAAVLRCPLLPAPAGDPYTLSWYRQVGEGRSPQLLVSVRWAGSAGGSEVSFGPGFGTERVAAAQDGSLRISAPQWSDTAIYFCSLSLGGEQDGPGRWRSPGH